MTIDYRASEMCDNCCSSPLKKKAPSTMAEGQGKLGPDAGGRGKIRAEKAPQ